MARCSLYASLKYPKCIKTGPKPGCSCFKMPPKPTMKLRIIYIRVPNYMYETWGVMGGMYLQLFHMSFKIAVFQGLETIAMKEEFLQEEEWVKDLPVKYYFKLVPALPYLYNL